MTWNPVPHDRCELADLKGQTPVFPRRNPKRILVQPNLSAFIGGIEPAIDPTLCEEIKLRSKLRIEKQRQARTEKCIDAAVDQAGCGLLEVVDFQIQRAAQSYSKIVCKGRNCERVVEAIQEIIDVERARCASKHAQAEGVQ